jgi:hypothetical protein
MESPSAQAISAGPPKSTAAKKITSGSWALIPLISAIHRTMAMAEPIRQTARPLSDVRRGR